jgi:quinol monooxygenase YgiN
MLEQVVRLRVTLTVNSGQLDAFTRIANEMVAAAQSESGTLGYEWFSSADGISFTLLETYKDAAAVEAHFTGPVVGQLVPKLAEHVTITALEFYGDPGPKVTEMAAGFGAAHFPYLAGMNR